MKSHLLKIFFFFISLIMVHEVRAQLPQCSDTNTVFYFHGYVGYHEQNILIYDAKKPISATNPILNTIPPSPGHGLAVSPNITTGDPNLTFYCTAAYYHYYDDNSNTWINTGHLCTGGTTYACNLGAGGGYIYNVIGGSGEVYRYDGKGDDVFVLTGSTSPNLGIHYDVIADNDGNFYLLSTDVPWSPIKLPNWLRKYNPSGKILKEWELSGLKGVLPHAGFAIMDNSVYLDGLYNVRTDTIITDPTFKTEYNLYKGEVCGDVIHFNQVDTLTKVDREAWYGDMANCPQRLYSYIKDTICYREGAALNIRSSGINGPYSYTVLEGSANVFGSDRNFTVSPNSVSTTVLLHGIDYCNNIRTDTFTFVRYPTLDAGSDITVLGCGQYIDTLHASLRDTIGGLSYSLEWSPSDFVTSGEGTLHPVIQPTANTTFLLKLSTPQCGIIKDSVRVTLNDVTVKAGFTFDYNYACASDTITFTNTSVNNTHNSWHFGDLYTDDVVNPVHTYLQQDNYKVTLLSWNKWCADSISHYVDTRHPLAASFTMHDDTICLGDPVIIINTSELTLLPERYHWDFGDGATNNTIQSNHVYTQPGSYKIQLILIDGIPCTDTFTASVLVDSFPNVSLHSEPKEICVGQSVNFSGDYTSPGNTGISWDLGDAGFSSGGDANGHTEIDHAYHGAGAYPVIFTAHYRACNDRLATDTVYVTAPPLVYLGSDGALCLKGVPIILKNLDSNEADDRYLWNTGDTTEQITVRYPGRYSLTIANRDDCTGTDSIVIKKDCYIEAPNAFTPNGDGYNDYFFPRQLLSQSGITFKLQILNRWGQSIFETTSIEGRGWDGKFNGKEQAVGVYVYLITITFTNGQNEIYQGNVTLMR